MYGVARRYKLWEGGAHLVDDNIHKAGKEALRCLQLVLAIPASWHASSGGMITISKILPH